MLTVCDKQPLSLGLTTNLNFWLAFGGHFHPFTMAASSGSLYFIPCWILDANYIWQCKHIIIVSVLQKREKEGYDTANLL